MKQRKWSAKEKFRIVLEGIKGEVPLGELCSKYGLAQGQYYKWRDRFLKEGEKAFEPGGVTANEERLKVENLRLRKMIGDLTIELKKTEDDIAALL